MSLNDVNGPKLTLKPAPLWHRDFGLLVGVWAFMAASFVVGGAYDTDEFGLIHRIAFWVIVTALFVFQPVFIERVLARFTPATRPGALLSSLGAVLLTVPIAAVQLHLMKSTPLLPRAADPWVEFLPFVAAPVLVVAGFVLFLRFAWERRHLGAEPTLHPAAQDPESKTRIIGPETLYVRSQDHYLEVITDHGRRFVRGRLSDIKQTGQHWGYSPHRSWWIADRSVKACHRSGRDYKLILRDGTIAPVSRAHHAAIKARGWL